MQPNTGDNSADDHSKQLQPQKYHEQMPVTFAYSIANPGTVVVKLFNTPVCHTAVLCAQGANDFACYTQLIPVACPQSS